MKTILLVLIIFLSSCGWGAKERMIEVVYTNNTRDTVSIYTHHFELVGTVLCGIRSENDGGNVVISGDVRSYKIIK